MLFLVFSIGALCAMCFLFSKSTALILTGILLIIRQIIYADADVLLYLLEKFGPDPGAKLRGRVVWITGASRGIGAALAVRLAQCGARLALSARDEGLLEAVKKQCVDSGAADVLVVPLDVRQHDQHQQALLRVVQHFGELHVLVSNAGRSQRARWSDIEISVDRDMFELNVFSLVALVRTVNRHFREAGGGHHVVTSSAAGKFGAPLSASYTASKHALHGYFECLRLEGAVDNIAVTMLCPGPVTSDILRYCYTGQLDKPLDMTRKGVCMPAERCAELSVVAMAYRLGEAWICQQPILAVYYVMQYCPTLPMLLLRLVGLGPLMKLRDDRADLMPPAQH